MSWREHNRDVADDVAELVDDIAELRGFEAAIIASLESRGYEVRYVGFTEPSAHDDPLVNLYGCLNNQWRTRGETLKVAKANGFTGASDQTLYNRLLKHFKDGRIEREGERGSYRWRLTQ